MAAGAETREYLADSAYRRLRRDIISCRLEPGQRITERALADETGFGVSPIREALTRLDHDGLVNTVPRKGYKVAPLTLKRVDDLFSFWQVIGPEVVRRGFASASSDQLARVAECLNAIETIGANAAITGGGFLRIVELGEEMFMTLAEAAGNHFLTATYVKLSGEVFRVWSLVTSSDLLTPAKLMDVTDWSAVIDRRDADALADCALRYIQACRDHLARTLTRWPSVMTSEVIPRDSASA